MEKCFVISLHRTGTRSTTQLLENLGMRAAHFVTHHGGVDLQKEISGHESDLKYIFCVLKPLIESVDAISDVPFPVLYPFLAREYPSAKFVLLHRNPWKWAKSVRAHCRNREFCEFERVQYWNYFPSKPSSIQEIPIHRLMQMQIRHTWHVSAFFKKLDYSRLLSMPLSNDDTASIIANFLGHGYRQLTMPYLK